MNSTPQDKDGRNKAINCSQLSRGSYFSNPIHERSQPLIRTCRVWRVAKWWHVCWVVLASYPSGDFWFFIRHICGASIAPAAMRPSSRKFRGPMASAL